MNIKRQCGVSAFASKRFALSSLVATVGVIGQSNRPTFATIIASDGFQTPPYTVGSLAGQKVGGTGFTGTWTSVPNITQDLAITSNGTVGRPGNNGLNSGDYATFATPLSLLSGQLFISYTVSNLGPALQSTRLDLNAGSQPTPGDRVWLGGDPGTGHGGTGDFALILESGLGAVTADSKIASVGSHQIMGVLDVQNDQIAIFIDPSSTSFYNTNGTNNANATASWTPPSGLSFSSYSLVENLSDQVNFGAVTFSTTVAIVPEPSSLTLLGLGGIALLRRRRSGEGRRSSNRRGITQGFGE